MDTDKSIRIVGAREHNLRDVSLRIPKDRITVFTGVSGSGKSSIAFDTVAVEAMRQLNATFPTFIRNLLPRYERPHVDTIENLTTPVIVDQRPIGGNARSTVGTVTDIAPLVRALFARYGEPSDGSVSTFSFNDPQGMCPECEGLGEAMRADLDLMLDRTKSLREGAILVPAYKVDSPDWQIYGNSERFDPDKPLADFSTEEWQDLLHGTGGEVELKTRRFTFNAKYEGLLDRFNRQSVKRDLSTLSDRTRATIARFISTGRCPACDGARLNPSALAARLGGRNIADWSRMQITDLIAALAELEDTPAAAGAAATRAALERVDAIGLGYLTLDRATPTLSGGEGQRLKLVRHLGSSLTGMTYVFDEPSTGLHPRDVGRVNDLLRALRDQGNTVLVVEHDPDVIVIADHIIDVGPGAGTHGGEIVFAGTVEALRGAETPTGRGLRRANAIKPGVREPGGWMPIVNARLHNLKDVCVDIPTGVLTVVTGVAGSGKSTLIAEVFLPANPDAIFVDQSAIAASSRSTPASFLGLMDHIRKLFAKASGAGAGEFSFNSKGACETCEGRGVIITELAFIDPVTTHCQSCDGRRFKDEVLVHKLRGKSIADVLEMAAEEAVAFFTEAALHGRLGTLVEVGLGYLSLGQPLSSLSGGERQRIKLATQLQRTGTVYVLDEPTTGLHLSDVDTLLAMLDGLVEQGNTVIVIEHNLDVVGHADWVIDLGPDAGTAGGEIVFAGPPRELMRCAASLTGEHLGRHVA